MKIISKIITIIFAFILPVFCCAETYAQSDLPQKKEAKQSNSKTDKNKFETYSCEYQDIARNIELTGHCHKQQTDFSGKFGFVLTWPSGGKVTIEYVNSQSGNHIWKINDNNAVAIEINREHIKGFSMDLNQFIEWQDRP